MCLILLAYDTHPRYDLVVLANRDEFYERPSRQARFWDDAPHVLAGRDLQAGGTWLGVHQSGRVAAVTNVREPGRYRQDAESRGDLVADFLRADIDTGDYIHDIQGREQEYNGFNLLTYDGRNLGYAANRFDRSNRILDAGVHGLSNADLNRDWPKVASGKRDLTRLLESERIDPMDGLEILADEARAPDEMLPDTGVGLELERALSPRLIRSPDYGTRTSTVVLVEKSGRIVFVEKTWVPADVEPSVVEYELVPS